MAIHIGFKDRALGKLLEKQVRNWELGRQQRLETPKPKRPVVEDFIAISREVGTDGLDVATRLGHKLGWAVFDKEILDAMAGDDALRRQIYESMDERDVSIYEEMLRSLMQVEYKRNDYFRRLSETILSLACQGCAVFLGRGADLILPLDRGFRVRLVAPFDQRARDFATRFNIGRAEAEAAVLRIEQERGEFIRHHFRLDPAAVTRHDLIVNLQHFAGDAAVDLILAARDIAKRSAP